MNTQDNEDHNNSAPAISPLARQLIPNSPPPSFRSRNSSLERRRQQNVDSTLADAFDADGDDSSDDEADDRQRLVRQSSSPVAVASTNSSRSSGDEIAAPDRSSTQWPVSAPGGSTAQASSRVYGGGMGGVFSNITARPERGEKIVEEQPPVCYPDYLDKLAT